MSDIRSRLADALRAHYLWDECDVDTRRIARCRCDVDNPSITNSVPDGGWMPFDEYFVQVADVLLSLPGIAIVSAEDLQIVLRNAGFHGIAGSYSEWVTAHHQLTAAVLAAAVQAQEEK